MFISPRCKTMSRENFVCLAVKISRFVDDHRIWFRRENTISFFLPIFLKDKERLKYISNENYISQKKKKKKELSFSRNRSEVKTFSQTYNKNNFGIYNMYGNITIKIKIINSLNNFTFTHVYVFMLNDRKIISRKIISRISTLSKIFFHN